MTTSDPTTLPEWMRPSRIYRLADISAGYAIVLTAYDGAVIGYVARDETRYNLRRQVTSRYWKAVYEPGHHRDREVARDGDGRTRRYRTRDDAATAVVVRHYRGDWAK